MKKIGLLSDTHGYLDENIFYHLQNCDEIWHAGDFGINDIPNTIINHFKNVLKKEIIFRGVYGNIDDANLRNIYPEKLFFTCEQVKVFMIHIGGYPNKYSLGIKDVIIKNNTKLFITGHSHILKIMYDQKLQCLHINPGAAGKQGWQKVRTIVRFTIDGENIKDCEVIELN